MVATRKIGIYELDITQMARVPVLHWLQIEPRDVPRPNLGLTLNTYFIEAARTEDREVRKIAIYEVDFEGHGVLMREENRQVLTPVRFDERPV